MIGGKDSQWRTDRRKDSLCLGTLAHKTLFFLNVFSCNQMRIGK